MVKVDGTTVTISSGIISASGGGSYTLPASTTTTRGGVTVPATQGLLLVDGSGNLTFDTTPTFTGLVTASSVDVNGGNVDGTIIGAAIPAAGAFTNLTLTGSKIETTVTVTSGSSYTVQATDINVVIKKTSGSATAVTLPSSPATGRIVTIKDGKFDAATNNITISPATGTIDGATSVVLQGNGASVTLEFNGTEWNIIGSTGVSSGMPLIENVTVVTSGSSYSATSTDTAIVVNKSSGSATGITLPASPQTGRIMTIKDGRGDAGTNNITITPAAGLIDGLSSVALSNAFAYMSLGYNGTSWNILAS